MSLSVYLSMELVASSNSKILVFFNNARPMQINCFCPAEKLLPDSATMYSNFSAFSSTNSNILIFFRTSHTSSSVYSPNGSKLNFNEPLNSTGSCGIMARFVRKSRNPNCVQSTPSSTISLSGFSGSTKRNNDSNRLLFPDPVRPQIPIFSPAFTVILISSSTKSKSARYRIFKCLISNLPVFGHEADGGRYCGLIMPASLLMLTS
mmetsp:Transcript_25406/g.40427  ORF Transcript_25406/g.40427 Transcript_25406/m.40427 type:complete len:206 (+) Transcript_25406:468-1085(+)